MENTKLHVKIGNCEFNGEGPQDWLKEAYERFLESSPENLKSALPTESRENTGETATPQGVDGEILARAFVLKDEVVSLRHLPPSENTNRTGDAAILLLYGFKKLLKFQDVLVTKLNEGLRQSGLTVKRLDKSIAVHTALYRKGGQRSGGRYSLTNQGELQAENWLKAWYKG